MALRERVQSLGSEIPKLAEEAGVKLTVGLLVLGAEHEVLVVAEADRVEAVDELLTRSGLIQWDTARVIYARSTAEVLGELSSMPPPLR